MSAVCCPECGLKGIKTDDGRVFVCAHEYAPKAADTLELRAGGVSRFDDTLTLNGSSADGVSIATELQIETALRHQLKADLDAANEYIKTLEIFDVRSKELLAESEAKLAATRTLTDNWAHKVNNNIPHIYANSDYLRNKYLKMDNDTAGINDCLIDVLEIIGDENET